MTYVFLTVLVLMSVLATLAIAWPLRKASPRLFAVLMAAVPSMALGLYLVVGTPAALDRDALQRTADGPATLDEAIAGLRGELERNPAQVDGWVLLGRSYAMQGRFTEAREALERALALLPDDASLLIEVAEARAQSNAAKRFDDEAIAMLRKASALDPSNQRAPWFIGIAHRQRGENAEAAAAWEALLPRLDVPTATALRQQIDAAREAADLPPLAAPAPQDQPAPAAQGLRVRVALDPDFAARVRLRGDTAVFVIARIPGGPPMPVAVQRHALQDLPLDIVLGDGDSPMPTQKLSELPEVEVFARLSASGDAARNDGDVESAPVRVTLPADAAVELVIGP